MTLTPEKIRSQFLNTIMKENHVSLKAVCKCMEKRKADIEKMDHIFDSDEGMSVRKRMVLLSIISRSNAKENIDYYRMVKNINSGNRIFVSDINKYKVLIITALLFNATFYVCACNWCGLIRWEINRINEEKNTDDSPVRIYEIKPGLLEVAIGGPIYKIAAASKEKGFNKFYELPLTYDGITGKLFFMGRDKKEVYLEFVFDKFQKIIPFELQVRFSIKNKEYTFVLEHRRKDRETVIFSDPQMGVYYSDGIEGVITS